MTPVTVEYYMSRESLDNVVRTLIDHLGFLAVNNLSGLTLPHDWEHFIDPTWPTEVQEARLRLAFKVLLLLQTKLDIRASVVWFSQPSSYLGHQSPIHALRNDMPNVLYAGIKEIYKDSW